MQPLSGEYAARRPLLESLPFFTGYGVELGMLIDTLTSSAPTRIAQVDLDCRVHRNQWLPALSRMAFGIMQVAAQPPGRRGPCQPSGARGRTPACRTCSSSAHGDDVASAQHDVAVSRAAAASRRCPEAVSP